jgi:hypothetical protein
MQQTIQTSGITFAVDAVTPATKPLSECRTHEAVRHSLQSDIESCCDYSSAVVRNVSYQPLLAAVYLAFSQHRPLVLTPDAVWITIAQGVAHHMAIHGEKLRSRFVAHQGKLDLVFQVSDWVEGSPENPWPEAFAAWAGLIRDHVGAETHDALVCDFSTTGPVERAVSQIVLMDVFERYFRYVLYCICGIPTVTLEGTPADWQRLADKAAHLDRFDLGWWLEHLLPICNQFVRASRGDVDPEHWQAICKLREEYGGDIINGWVAKLFPYLRAFRNGPCTRRNPIFETGEGFQTSAAPSGLSRVPFRWRNGPTSRTRAMEAIGGLIGVTQDPRTLALRPKAGWAVREAEKMDVLLTRLSAEHRTVPGKPAEDLPSFLPPDLGKFYHHTAGAELIGPGNVPLGRILPPSELEHLDWGPIGEVFSDVDYPNGQSWYRLARLPDGSSLAINPGRIFRGAADERLLQNVAQRQQSAVLPVCHCTADTHGKPGQNPVIALVFEELLERWLNAGGQPYWLAPDFVGYGDAEEYTRRK